MTDSEEGIDIRDVLEFKSSHIVSSFKMSRMRVGEVK
jgi:hypothetical protein